MKLVLFQQPLESSRICHKIRGLQSQQNTLSPIPHCNPRKLTFPSPLRTVGSLPASLLAAKRIGAIPSGRSTLGSSAIEAAVVRSWTTRREAKQCRMAQVEPWMHGKVIPAARIVQALELLLAPGDKVIVEENYDIDVWNSR